MDAELVISIIFGIFAVSFFIPNEKDKKMREKCRRCTSHVCIDTSGYCPYEDD